jgi:hypothetical protein
MGRWCPFIDSSLYQRPAHLAEAGLPHYRAFYRFSRIQLLNSHCDGLFTLIEAPSRTLASPNDSQFATASSSKLLWPARLSSISGNFTTDSAI